MHNIFNNEILVNLNNTLNNNLVELIPYKFNKTFAIKCGKVIIKSFNDEIVLDLDQNIDKHYMTNWYSTPIKIILRDFKTNNIDNYYVAEFDGVYYLLRKLDQDTISYLKKKNVKNPTDVKCGDIEYAVISITTDRNFTESCYSTEYEFTHIDEDDELEDDNENIELDSLELFEDSDLYD